MFVYVCMYADMCPSMCMCVWDRRQRQVSLGGIFQVQSLFFSEIESLLGLELSTQARLPH